MSRQPTIGMRHVALFVYEFDECEKFYRDLLEMEVEWRPDDDNVYLTSGTDNLALHRREEAHNEPQKPRLDHIGFILPNAKQVDEWHKHFVANGVKIISQPKTHRDGARSFYCKDPDGTVVQMIHHPPISNKF